MLGVHLQVGLHPRLLPLRDKPVLTVVHVAVDEGLQGANRFGVRVNILEHELRLCRPLDHASSESVLDARILHRRVFERDFLDLAAIGTDEQCRLVLAVETLDEVHA